MIALILTILLFIAGMILGAKHMQTYRLILIYLFDHHPKAIAPFKIKLTPLALLPAWAQVKSTILYSFLFSKRFELDAHLTSLLKKQRTQFLFLFIIGILALISGTFFFIQEVTSMLRRIPFLT